MTMELVTELVGNNHLALFIPAVVLVVAILVFALGFKHAEQPPFDKLSSGISDDRKQVGKKRKIKEKKTTANGHITNIGESKVEKSPTKDRDSKRSPAKEVPETPKQIKEKKQEVNATKQSKKTETVKYKKPESLEDVKNKKNLKAKYNEKPLDYDEGDWEKVPTKSDKKKKQESPAKKEKDKKPKKPEKSAEIDKLVKEEVNKELREKIKELEVKPVESDVVLETVPIIEEKKEKKKEKKPKKEIAEKVEKLPAKKNEKIEEVDEEPPAKEKIDQPSPPIAKEGVVVFDEIGDVWEEPKAAKKSKKKSRRDN